MSVVLKELFQENDSNKIVLPDFQRDLEWKIDKQKSLLSSFLVHLPIGSILLLKGSNNDFPARSIGVNNAHVEPSDDCMYLLDGQQRVTSLKVFFSDFFHDAENWADVWESLYSQLRTRWFVRVKPMDGEEDFFGYEKLTFKDSIIKKSEPSYVYDLIEYKKIYKTKDKEWHHPNFYPLDDGGNRITGSRRELFIAKECSREYLVPLYPLYRISDTSRSLTNRVLEQIANNRKDELKADVDSCNEQEKSRILRELFEEFDLDDENEVDRLWTELSVKWQTNVSKFFDELLDQKITQIVLPKDEIARGISIFTSINEGGQKLSTYDLVVAKAAKTLDESLSNRIRNLIECGIDLPSFSPSVKSDKNIFGVVSDNKLTDKLKNHYLNVLSIYTHTAYGDLTNMRIELLKAKMHLMIDSEKISANTNNAVKAIIRAYIFLQIRCGVLGIDNLSYQLMVIPIAYIFISDAAWCDEIVWNKLEYWYWSSLFSGYYREAQNERSIKDLKELYLWIFNNELNPFNSRFENIFKETNYSDLDTLLYKNEEKSVPKSVHNGILQFVLSCQPLDFIKINGTQIKLTAWDFANGYDIKLRDSNGKEITETLKLHDHHIFPLATATNIGQSSSEIRSENHLLNSPLNRTFISSYANKEISARDANSYLSEVSVYSQYNHMIPSEIPSDYFSGESRKEYYEKILKKRYELLKSTIVNRLTGLV